MPISRHLYYFLFLLALISCKTEQLPTLTEKTVSSTSISEPILTLGIEKFDTTSFDKILDTYLITDSSNFDDVIDEILFQKRVFALASEQGYTKDEAINEEFNSYLKIVAQSFIVDSALTNNLARITYNRMKKEINASHLLIPISEFANPKDTLLAFDRISLIRDMYLQGVPFDSLARVYSGDANTKGIGGEMGWFSALQLLYPLENAAYNTSVDSVSQVIRTKAGYHLLKVNGTRNFSGRLFTKHLLKVVPKESTPDFIAFQKNSIDSLYSLIKKGANFETLCQTNSDDIYSKDNSGLLEPFSVGSRKEKAFEKMAFSLKVDEVSEPVKTEVGWHIIKLVKKEPLNSFEEIEPTILKKVTTDSRGEYLKKLSFKKYAPKLNIKENKAVLEEVIQTANQDILEKNWKVNKNGIALKILLTVAGDDFTNLDFYRYAEDKQTFEKEVEGFTPDMYIRSFYKDFKTSKVEEAIVNNLSKWNSDFKLMSLAYKENLVNSSYLNKEIYEKSVLDSLGLKNYYNNHLASYQLPKRAKALILKSKNKALLDKYFETTKGEGPYRLKRGILPAYFDKNVSILSEDVKRKLVGLTVIMQNNPNYVVEIGGHRDVNEEVEASYLRIQEVVNFLKKNGLRITQIREYDYGTSHLSDRFDWTQNQRVSFQFFTTQKIDVARTIKLENDSLTVTEGEFYKGENVMVDATAWETGSFEAEFDDEFYRIEIDKVSPARTKTYREAFGSVVSDYQNELKEQLSKELAVKYPAQLNRKELLKLYTDHKKKNL
ncbi:peptidylprolyl isomerase [uncultured Arcticibacterium sp.]|uniref:peptidylprolyl isomerase n=1 Tax=uncultured Arcticibacterium sp. TaxID=2173042 RepID=UPI0030FB5D85